MEQQDPAKKEEEKKTTEGGTTEAPKKHETLQETGKDQQDEVELVKNKFSKNLASPFISRGKSWENEEHFQIPKDILQNIIDELGFQKPSAIQGVAVPLITSEPFHPLVAQARNGSGKTGAFTIGSTLRVNREDTTVQVLCIVNVRELCN